MFLPIKRTSEDIVPQKCADILTKWWCILILICPVLTNILTVLFCFVYVWPDLTGYVSKFCEWKIKLLCWSVSWDNFCLYAIKTVVQTNSPTPEDKCRFKHKHWNFSPDQDFQASCLSWIFWTASISADIRPNSVHKSTIGERASNGGCVALPDLIYFFPSNCSCC